MADDTTTTAMIAEDWAPFTSRTRWSPPPPNAFRWGWLAGHAGEDCERAWARYCSGTPFPSNGFTHKAWHAGYDAGAARRERGE